MTREQIALRFPVGTRARLLALALPRESMTDTVLRAIASLEQQEPQDQRSDGLQQRLSAIEQRLAALEQRHDLDASSASKTAKPDASRHSKMIGQTRPATSRQTPKQRPGDYPPEVREMAARMKMEGQGNAAICEAIRDRCGRAPNRKNATSVIRRWIEQLTAEGSRA